jgi:hypothetical protein
MEPKELTQVAATIASGMMATDNTQMALSPGRMSEIARLSVQLAKIIEKEAIASYK